ncbi:MAG: hypothetical protein AB1725_08090 [Armatimonadota bacterium]
MERRRGLLLTAVVVAFLSLTWVAFSAHLPPQYLAPASVVATVLFMFLPVCGIFLAAGLGWTPKSAAVVLLAGVVAVLLLSNLQAGSVWLDGAIQAALQFFRVAWPVALGILVGTLVRDKNLLIPIAVFLITFDILLVLAPRGPTRAMMQQPITRQAFETLAYQVPAPRSQAEEPSVRPQPLAQVGPADSLFLAMFAFALYRFGMRVRKTFVWMAVALTLYLGVVIFAGGASIAGIPLKMLPGLVPMGIVVLTVNRREFSLSNEERRLVYGVVAVCALLILGAFLLPRLRG